MSSFINRRLSQEALQTKRNDVDAGNCYHVFGLTITEPFRWATEPNVRHFCLQTNWPRVGGGLLEEGDSPSESLNSNGKCSRTSVSRNVFSSSLTSSASAADFSRSLTWLNKQIIQQSYNDINRILSKQIQAIYNPRWQMSVATTQPCSHVSVNCQWRFIRSISYI